ncbi:UDP-N-acetylglucosamine transferase subunit ALG13 homolog [Tribolium castaneum]|uniref:UDP-N-acetylglucosamine transferase subunit ALG13 n=1 Tax=Tribolium castaneum TaxID=7070 RepID=D6WAK7_TRICA|nr:PREDICTED: UDP-N-acetylglucosamine transferase subunit ALG13 homolog [Tribolium castaneum]EEZ98644.1 UDP-N-acetylglucosamine transferase subunit ALG13 homolog-like Protein [Tribolium castaneum]|eukprot:XP_967385.1 PREDICTED: UDP-N-acetylglucosamine transferase subunit ALG13 homolog [Tribolium castaneum]
MGAKKVFVTVGTTKFDKLIEEVSKDEVLEVLHSLGYTFVQFQVGTGDSNERKHPKIHIKYDRYFENFAQEIESSDLIISHAGAGTCLEVLKQHKPLIVVINEDLMDNHQIELAQQLAKDGYLQCCTPRTLKDTLLERKFLQFKQYPNPDPRLFSRYLDKCMGFEIK